MRSRFSHNPYYNFTFNWGNTSAGFINGRVRQSHSQQNFTCYLPFIRTYWSVHFHSLALRLKTHNKRNTIRRVLYEREYSFMDDEFFLYSMNTNQLKSTLSFMCGSFVWNGIYENSMRAIRTSV